MRGKTDEEVIKAILNITDSRFQKKLLKKAKKTRKIAKNYKIPTEYTENYPEKIDKFFKELQGAFPDFPFGSEFTEIEIPLVKALREIKNATTITKLFMTMKGAFKPLTKRDKTLLNRMDLATIKTIKLSFYRSLLLGFMK